MLLTVREFIETARGSMPILVERLPLETGRTNDAEAAAWRDSLTLVASMFEGAEVMAEQNRRHQNSMSTSSFMRSMATMSYNTSANFSGNPWRYW